jgi:hypothetical protein
MAKVKTYAIRAAIIIVGICLALLVPDRQAPVQPPEHLGKHLGTLVHRVL